jgi:diketogulonate reductase-like aldo/keto reductase
MPAGLLPVSAAAQTGAARAGGSAARTRVVPSTGEVLPPVGLGSWITFNVGDDAAARERCVDVMRAFFDAGGTVIDSSPMYGSSQAVIGHGLRRTDMHRRVFSADKVWIAPASRGAAQIEASRGHWGVMRFDLLQVHNLLAWQEHLPVLFAMKSEGRVRHVGITTSEGRRQREIEEIMATQPLDVVQVTYSLRDRRIESRILPIARDRGIAVIVNRPFEQGALLASLARHRLPGYAAELGCTSWAQLALKFVVGHPDVTCAIPATTRVDHVRENLAAGQGRLPDDALRRRMVVDVEKLV